MWFISLTPTRSESLFPHDASRPADALYPWTTRFIGRGLFPHDASRPADAPTRPRRNASLQPIVLDSMGLISAYIPLLPLLHIFLLSSHIHTHLGYNRICRDGMVPSHPTNLITLQSRPAPLPLYSLDRFPALPSHMLASSFHQLVFAELSSRGNGLRR
jgi:hypothetical protein